jgi:hypothetical protein
MRNDTIKNVMMKSAGITSDVSEKKWCSAQFRKNLSVAICYPICSDLEAMVMWQNRHTRHNGHYMKTEV